MGFSRMITAWVTRPYWLKYSVKVSLLVSHAMPHINSFPSSESTSFFFLPLFSVCSLSERLKMEKLYVFGFLCVNDADLGST